ncbi:cytidine deaminase [Maribacter sp. 2307ULW6-5]|uniref:cytidine deaminase n=1 Tax=Maribacter sp. 2307ULW6-5 TaxID=3386275 RepID=UPI0039BC627C
MAQKKTIHFDVLVHDDISALSRKDQALVLASQKALEGAYAPYSEFKVGAALLLDNGEVVIGSNQENASYPSGLCAERVAVFQAGACFPGVGIRCIAVSAASNAGEVVQPAAPCGNCRQSIYEYEHRQGKPIRILLMGQSGPVWECSSIADILPLGFNSSFLG